MATIDRPSEVFGDTPEQRKAQRLEQLWADDPQFAASKQLDSVKAAKRRPNVRLAEVVEAVMEGYADRPALGQRARELVNDPATGRATLRLLPRFDTITYRELWGRARAAASTWHHDAQAPLKAGDFVCILGFTSPAYATILLADISLGAVNVPLQTSAPPAQHQAIIAETEPRILATSIDYVEAAAEAVLLGQTLNTAVPDRLVVFDYDLRDDDQRERLAAARMTLSDAGCPIVVDTFDEVIARGSKLETPPLYLPGEGEDPLAWLFYTSGSTGTPKGAIFTQSLVIGTWLHDHDIPSITLSFMPMAHLVGNGYLLMALANGGTSYCAPKADLSTMFEDFSLARPTMASIVPRVCELFHHRYLGELDLRVAAGEDEASAAEAIKREMRETILGGRLLSVGCGSASLAPETYVFMEDMLDLHMPIGYSSTEIAGGTVLVDWKIQRPPVIDYKLADVPELGYFSTDKPYPRGELLVKSERFMGGYYKRADLTAEKFENGYYRTGDVMAELGPDHLVFVDRCNNVIKLSQGEFVAIQKLEAAYAHHAAIRQIYVYGTSERAFLLAVIVPNEELVAQLGEDGGTEKVKSALRRALNEVAEHDQLNGWEIPRDFIIEADPFSLKNGLLSEIGKHQRPKLKDRYGESLEAMYAQLAQDQFDTLRRLRGGGAERPVLDTVIEAVQATLGLGASDVQPNLRFIDLGGDSLAALSFSTLLEEIFGIEVPVGVIINPAGDIRGLADYVETARGAGGKRPSFATVHQADSGEAKASDLTLDKFIDADILAKAAALPAVDGPIRTVLMTGATGFLGRFQALAWLERLAETGGKLLLLARGADAAQARARVEAAIESDPQLLAHFRALAEKHLEVLPGDLGLPGLGLDEATWDRLAQSVDLIVHPGAHVNHVLPYNQLFAANVTGTAELIRLAITGKLKRFHYVSTLGVNSVATRIVDEDGDIRELMPRCGLDDGYANGYGISKWASEVLLREAHDLTGLPVSVFRPGMILAHSRYAGQINVPDMFTRLLFSLAATGIAPATFYAQDLSNGRPRARYDGLSVDFLAESLTAIDAQDLSGFRSYNLSGQHDDGVSLDDFVDWMIAEGCTIERIDGYDDWLSRFETAMRLLPEEQRAESMLAILDPYRQPQRATNKSMLPADRFQSATKAAGYEIPPVSSALIAKYVADLRHLKLL
ncbi:carboxylic acid reductase [Novosphingobium sp. JCM 18896]|uniref:carboxylic acid reductase n=1 Tax=Novosphingobium sp. JCM 18896 TaxID=2989731 RepID=UPI0022235207|nr:carboxylic acid reductase [Novosphingobium sp. JCM 18896]MCW1428623.1 thioester reductase domain-containing protein [Novosphingobium sp. JCM 18896]